MQLLTVMEVAMILGISPSTLYQWSWLRKNLPFVRVGGALRIRKVDLEQFIRENRQDISETN